MQRFIVSSLYTSWMCTLHLGGTGSMSLLRPACVSGKFHFLTWGGGGNEQLLSHGLSWGLRAEVSLYVHMNRVFS
jgi:hypothetical protein